MKLDITDFHFIELQKKGYTIDMMLILSWINKNLSIDHIINGSKKIEIIYKTMKRKGLITEDDKLSKIGIELLDFISLKTNKTLMKPKPKQSDFDEWWNIFPTTDIFTFKGKTFEGTRSLRTGKPKALLYFNKFILDGAYTKEQIINGTLYDVQLKKKASLRTGVNNLTFLSNAASYLFNEKFEPFIKFGKPKIETEKTKLGSIDI